MTEETELKAQGEIALDEAETADAAAGDVTAQMVEALKARADFYDLLAALYFRPMSAEQIENLAAMDLTAYAEINDLFADGVNDVTRYLRKRNTGTRQELNIDFTASFGSVSSWKGRYASPYESVFTSEDGLMFQDAYHDVYRLYKENHVAPADGYDYPHDHLSFMCEFMAIQSERMVEALEAGERERALTLAEASRGFLRDHILSWFDDLQELALKLQKTRFYRGIMKMSKGFFLEDDELLGSIIVELEEEGANEDANADEL